MFEDCIIKSMSEIGYYKDSVFIKERIQLVLKIFREPDNQQYLISLIDNKLQYSEFIDKLINEPIMSVAKNEFYMKSNSTFHGAALELVKQHLSRYLSFIIFYLEQDGIINAYQNSSDTELKLFEIAKGYFLSRYDESYAKIEMPSL